MNNYSFKILLLAVGLFVFNNISVYGQGCPNYTVTPIPYAAPPSSGTPVILADDALSGPIPIGFSFNFYCNSYSNLQISSNGFLTFDLQSTHNGCCSGQVLPSNTAPNNLIAFAWEDINPANGGTVEYFSGGTAPNRYFVVHFDSVPRFGGASVVSVHVVLRETTNFIDVFTTSITADGATTVGVENINGTMAATVLGRNGGIWSATLDGYRFSSGNSFAANIFGNVYQDFNQNCQFDSIETGLARNLIINPGNIITQSDAGGTWYLDSLPAGTYTVTIDTAGPWVATCPTVQTFTVIHPDSLLYAPSFGLLSTSPCAKGFISINAPFLRPGFSNQRIYVQACNDYLATDLLDSAYVIIEIDSLFTIQAGSLPYTALGNNQYRIEVDTIYPGDCVNFWLEGTLSTAAILGQSLCMGAVIYPIDSCALDTIPQPYLSPFITPCELPWDNSSLSVTGSCVNDSVRFVIYNTGAVNGGDMDCFAPVRLYLDGQYIWLDSIQLAGGDSIVFMFDGNGQTVRLEVDQHPLHPGNSQPNATVELCGNPANWTPNLVNILPHDDANSFVDIFCGVVRGSYDPNDKRGFPLGTGNSNDILPNQDLEYVIRFQNTGTDTAFTVVIRDTLPTTLDILSVHSGVSSHPYTFKMYGPRILEWTFEDILLPDSTTNEPASNGFVTFQVQQVEDLPNSTRIENSAAIYFDFNSPIITNTSLHTINDNVVVLDLTKAITKEMDLKVYPNPTSERLMVVRGSNQAATITIIDQLGRVVLLEQVTDASTQLNIRQLPAGVYYLSVEDGKKRAVQKIIKQ